MNILFSRKWQDRKRFTLYIILVGPANFRKAFSILYSLASYTPLVSFSIFFCIALTRLSRHSERPDDDVNIQQQFKLFPSSKFYRFASTDAVQYTRTKDQYRNIRAYLLRLFSRGPFGLNSRLDSTFLHSFCIRKKSPNAYISAIMCIDTLYRYECMDISFLLFLLYFRCTMSFP